MKLIYNIYLLKFFFEDNTTINFFLLQLTTSLLRLVKAFNYCWHFFHPAELHLLRSFFLSNIKNLPSFHHLYKSYSLRCPPQFRGQTVGYGRERKRKRPNRALVCGGQMEQEGRSRMVEMSLVLVGLWAWSRQLSWQSTSRVCWSPRIFPGWDVLAFFPSC